MMKKVLSLFFLCAIVLGICACSNLFPEPEPDVETILVTGTWSSDHRGVVRQWSDYCTWEEGYWIRFATDGTFEGGYADATGDPTGSDYTIELKDTWGYWRFDGEYVVVTSTNHRFNMRLKYEDGVLVRGSADGSVFHQTK